MIPDNNHITWSAEDIRRYWNGQLSPEEMHAMEKAALDDPFLADAMEGYGEAVKEKGNSEVLAQLSKLHEQVQAQSEKKKGAAPVRSFRWWQVAAAAIVLVVAGLWVFTYRDEDKQREVATLQNTPAPDAERKADPGSITLTDSIAPGSAASHGSAAGEKTSASKKEVTEKADSDVSSERGLTSFQSKPADKQFDDAANYRAKRSPLKPGKTDMQKDAATLSNVPAIVSSSAPVSIKDTPESKREMEVVVFSEGYKKLSERKAETDVDENKRLQNFVSGVVTDNKNNPLSNAFLLIGNNNRGYTTDLRGQFEIPVQDSVVKLSVTVPGYASAQFQLKSTYDGTGYATDNKLQLQPQANLASQGYAAGAGQKFAKRKESNKAALDEKDYIPTVTAQDAQPVYGWVGNDKDLNENKRRPQENPHLVGEVVVSFMVDKKRQLSDFKVEKSLSPEHDAEALRLVREGPPWKLRKGRKSRVTVIVRF